MPVSGIPGGPGALPGPPTRDVVSGDFAVPPAYPPGLQPAPAGKPQFSITWVDPLAPPPNTVDSIRIPVLNPFFTFNAVSDNGAAMQVQLQSSLTSDFATPTTTTLTSVPSGVNTSTQIGPFTNGQHYFYRIRAGDGSVWSLWNVGMQISFDTSVANALSIIYENVGVVVTDTQNNYAEMYENVGVLDVDTRNNLSMIYEGDVNTTTPTPHIWFIRPQTGRSGDGFTIYGHGFGATQGTYSGILQFLESGVWTTVGVASWTLVAADGNAYTSARIVDEVNGIIDAEHNEVFVTIPSGLVPPGYSIRIETNGP